MKKFAYFLLLVAIALSSNAQTVGEAFYIYRNDGQFNAFFRDEVDSIAYSNYDADSVYYDDVVTQLIYTQDSLYRIPLAAIDSVGFVQPETIYKKDAVPLVGELFDYLISSSGLSLTFSSSIPSTLRPNIGDKIVATELTDKLPLGFIGRVRQVEQDEGAYVVFCDSLDLEDAVNQFYGIVEIVSQQNDGNVRRYLSQKVYSEKIFPFGFMIPTINQKLDLTPIVKPKEKYKMNGKATAIVTLKPAITGKIVRVVDNYLNISHYNIHMATDLETVTEVELAGEANKDDLFEKLCIEETRPGPWGIPIYYAFGPKLEMKGDLAVGTTVYADFTHIVDITYYPLVTAVGMIPGMPTITKNINVVRQCFKFSRFDMDWVYIAGKISGSLGIFGRLGIAFGNHKAAWVGGEAQIGGKLDVEIEFDFEALKNAERGTVFYDALKENSKVEIMPYWGLEGKISAVDDRYMFTFIGRDDFTFWGAKWQWDFLPIFSDTKATLNNKNRSSIDVSANITNDCLIPYTVGFSLFDENGNMIGEPQWHNQEYRFRKDFSLPYMKTFTDLTTNKKYKVYPTFRLLGFNVLASPSAELEMQFPVIYTGYEVTKAQYKQGGFTNDGITYNYRFDVTVSFYLRDRENVIDWGYVYLDPNGKTKEISLMQFGYDKDDNRYAYFRNKSDDTVCLYGYVKYANGDIIYGEPIYLGLHYECQLCPDNNHPHMLDLGLPSGTKWACCNLGASSPEKWGGYYAWGETEEKECDYLPWTYQHAIKVNDEDGWGDYFLNEETGDKFIYSDIGSNISGTQYDAATALWSDKWCMPTKEQFRELYMECSNSGRTLYNGCVTLVGPNGTNAIVIPEQGYRVNKDDTVNDVWNSELGNHPAMHYWTSEIDVYSKEWHQWTVYGVYEWHSDAWEVKSWGNQIQDRCHGLPIRPVAKEAK